MPLVLCQCCDVGFAQWDRSVCSHVTEKKNSISSEVKCVWFFLISSSCVVCEHFDPFVSFPPCFTSLYKHEDVTWKLINQAICNSQRKILAFNLVCLSLLLQKISGIRGISDFLIWFVHHVEVCVGCVELAGGCLQLLLQEKSLINCSRTWKVSIRLQPMHFPEKPVMIGCFIF